MMTHLMPFYLKNLSLVEERPGETPSALRSLYYLITSSLTDIKRLLKTSRGAFSVPFLCLCQKLSLSLLYVNKTLLHKNLWVVKPHLWPQIEISPPEVMNPSIAHGSQQQPFTGSHQFLFKYYLLRYNFIQ